MTESLYFEANEDKAAELDRLAAWLDCSQEDLLNEALDLLLAAHRNRKLGEEPIGLLAGLHDLMHRLRKMIYELEYIRMTTCGPEAMLWELGVPELAINAVAGHYEQIYQSSERALAAAGFGPMLVNVMEANEDARDAPGTPQSLLTLPEKKDHL